MESSFRSVMGAAFVGILLGVAGLVFGVVSKNKADQLRGDFSQVQDLFEKIREVEESSTGISAGAARIRREVEFLRDGTQEALNQVSDELTRLRRDLNNSTALAQRLEQKLAEFSAPPAPVETAPAMLEEPQVNESAAVVEEPQVEDSAAVVEDSGATEIYRIRSGDTLTRVAIAHGVSLAALTEANPDVDPLRLQIGQEIRIPAR